MTWNYTKSGLYLSVVALAFGLFLKPMAGQVLAIIVVLPACMIADVVSWWRHRRVTARLPER